MRGMIVVALALAACSSKTPTTGDSTKKEMEQTERNHQRLVSAVPPPQLRTSAERMNLKRRLERWNDENKVSYIYLIDRGVIVSHYTIKGKVSSVNSKLTTGDQIVRSGTLDHRFSHVIESPALDGSYGSNGDAIFFFLTNGAYVEWSGTYLLFDKPMRLTQKPLLIAADSE